MTNNKSIALLAIPVFAAVLFGSAVLTPQAFAQNEKVQLCHLNSANDVIEFGTVIVSFGNSIEVSENAVAAHEENHGDSTNFIPLDEQTRDLFEQVFGITLPNADCYFFV